MYRGQPDGQRGRRLQAFRANDFEHFAGENEHMQCLGVCEGIIPVERSKVAVWLPASKRKHDAQTFARPIHPLPELPRLPPPPPPTFSDRRSTDR